ncbi:Bax inhibitor-1/YccA family protein [Bifidobacterium vespertilionis]|uniref:Bax inhibitor-1/YccA family protein n=1 Tax=Bifidobacterium vespertilionis TaxID=2562524 RepID=A0A5J5E3N7_9BIFI|nr:Bax inhibitor-1/YccA family protein [Bifidobacterium vespertilionis]KAA8820035.1 Bax inhibitor-1/YccA family protein [Bifidobacterium vespertilionis]KAA8823733.1 Bax inhibitor-1/YccA family protein [Bifidobacterium vespertilionis]
MSFGRIPENNNRNQAPYGQPYAGPQFQQNANQQPQYGQPYANPQYAQPGMNAGTATMDANLAYSYEKAQRVSITKAYAEMAVGLLVTAAVAVFANASGALIAFLSVAGMFGWIGIALVQVALAIYLGARVMSMSPGKARAMFYVYAALMGFTLSSIFLVYDLGSIALVLLLCAGFFFALTMLGLTTKFDMLKAAPILFVGLIVLIIGQLLVSWLFPSDGMMQLMAAIGVVLFAGMTVYDAQSTRAIFRQYQNQGPEMIQRVSILCALSLYLDFVNMFLYLLQLFGDRE